MLIASLATNIIMVVAFVWLLNQHGKRAAASEVLAHGERATLMQRVQAPHAAVAEHHVRATEPVPPAGSGLPMSDEEMAEAQQIRTSDEEAAKWIAAVEAMENGHMPPVDGLLQ